MIKLDFLKKLSKNEKILLYATTAIIVLALGDYLILTPIEKKLRVIDEEIETKENTLDKNYKLLSIEEKVLLEYKNNIAIIKILGSDEEEIAKFLNAIEVISRESAISLIDMKPHVTKDNDISVYKKYLVETEIEGTVDKITTFMYNLQKSPQLLRIEKFSLNTKGEAISDILKGYLSVTKIVIPE